MSADLATPKWSILIDRLSQQTTSGNLKWKTSPDESTVVVKIGENHISVSRVRNQSDPDQFDFWVEIFRADGRLVDRFSDYMVSGSYSKLDDLYVAAFRQANGSDAVLDDILSHLPDPDEIPF